jgi:hypothetical protein
LKHHKDWDSDEKMKAELWNKTQGLCFWCGQKTLDLNKRDTKNPLNPTLDHVIPKAAGGKKEEGNIVLACKACNDVRGQYNISVWARRELEYKSKIEMLEKLATELKSAVASAKDRNKVEHDRLKNLVVWYVDTPWWKRLFRTK